MKQIKKERLYQHPIAKVWEAITEQKRISQWFIQADFKAQVGYQYKLTHESTVVSGEVTTVNPVFHLMYTWKVNEDPTTTLVSWRLEEKGDKTLLTLEHTGLENYDAQTAPTMFGHFSEGWEKCVEDLDQYLKKTDVKEKA